jgi:hypothetical protein
MNFKVNFYLFLHLSKQPAVGTRNRPSRKKPVIEEVEVAEEEEAKPAEKEQVINQ